MDLCCTTVRLICPHQGLEIVKKCSKVLLEAYTAVLPGIDAENLVIDLLGWVGLGGRGW